MANYGHIVVDECHHISARSFEIVVRQSKAKYITGLSATVIRKDGHHPIIYMNCGPVRFKVDDKKEAVAETASFYSNDDRIRVKLGQPGWQQITQLLTHTARSYQSQTHVG